MNSQKSDGNVESIRGGWMNNALYNQEDLHRTLSDTVRVDLELYTSIYVYIAVGFLHVRVHIDTHRHKYTFTVHEHKHLCQHVH